ncbi:MAG: hypothetical protein WKG01_20270 [Kofleriaceae bacterium]
MWRPALLAFALVACARRVPPVATANDAERGQVALGELERGRALVLGKCARCHATPLPSDHTATQWPGMINEMAVRSKLDAGERTAITRYLVVMAAAPAVR